MSPSVNYYHYSVFKLLVVNLRTRFGFAVSPKKFGFGQFGACLPVRLRLQNLASDPVLLPWPFA